MDLSEDDRTESRQPLGDLAWGPGWRRRWILAIAVTLVSTLVAIVWIDHPIALYMRDGPPDRIREVFKVISGLGRGEPYWIGGGIVLLGGLALSRLSASETSRDYYRRLAGSATFFLSALAATGISLLALKQLFGRLRPKYLWDTEALHGFFPFNADMGALAFPSGHTNTAFTVAMALVLITGRFRWPLFILAALVGLSRVVLAKHFVGDIFAGAFLGCAVTSLLYLWWLSRWRAPSLPPLAMLAASSRG